jgi:thioredoxin-like negative regulator of GroEL
VCKFYTDKGYVLISVESNDSALLPNSMQNVLGFPTLRAYNKGKPVEEFNDVRTFDAVSNFVETYGKVETVPAPKKKAAPAKPKAASAAAAPAKKKKKT